MPRELHYCVSLCDGAQALSVCIYVISLTEHSTSNNQGNGYNKMWTINKYTWERIVNERTNVEKRTKGGLDVCM